MSFPKPLARLAACGHPSERPPMYLTTELRPRTVIRDSFPLMVEANVALGGFRDLFDRGSARQHFSPPVDAQGGHSFFRCRLGNGPSAGPIVGELTNFVCREQQFVNAHSPRIADVATRPAAHGAEQLAANF